jgi:ATP-binding protein involved in chromosome partitioning
MAATSTFTDQQVLDALKPVQDPDLKRSIVALGMVRDIHVNGADVSFTFELTTPACPLKDMLGTAATDAIKTALPGVARVDIRWDAKVSSHSDSRKDAILPGVKNTIAVASGKGGVGKSTVAVNLAVALAREGANVGFIDADIYGPSAPIMFGLKGQQPAMISQGEAKKLVPLTAHGVQVMSIGFLVDPNSAVVWRGPMASGALKQFMTDVIWGDLDYLIFDLPPGTGDIQLTLVQTIPLTGAVIVTTPQDLSLADARKGYAMFEKLKVPVFGIIENMSYFLCPHCNGRSDIFSSGGGGKAAHTLGIPFLGAIPINLEIRSGGDDGAPIVGANPDAPDAQAFVSVARNVAQQISIRNATAPAAMEIVL